MFSYKRKLIVLLFVLCYIVKDGASFGLQRKSREMSVGQLFANLLDSIFSDTNTTTVNSTTFPSTFSFLNKLTPNTLTPKISTPVKTPPTSNLNITETTTNDGKTIETATWGPEFTLRTSTEPLFKDNCGGEYSFTELCGGGQSALLAQLNIWDVYSVIFSNDVIEALLLNCDSGHWCLYDEFDYWNGLMMEKAAMVKDSPIFSDICLASSLSCFDTLMDNVTGCPIQERMNFTVEAINLLCDMRKDSSLEVTCYGHLLAAFHVTVVEFLRDSDDLSAREESVEGNCRSPEILMTKSFLCVETKCPNHNTDLLSFLPWKWFTPNIEKSRTDCSLQADTCDEDAVFGPRATTSTPRYDGTTEDIWMSSTSRMQTASAVPGMANDASLTSESDSDDNVMSFPAKFTMILGVSAGGIIAISGFFVLVYACMRKHGPSRFEKGYQPLRNQD